MTGKASSPSLPAVEGIEEPNLRVGTLPIVGALPLYLALEEGLFRQVGLSVRLSEIQSGAFSVPSLIKGELDITFSNYVSLIRSYSEGIGTRIIAEGSRAAEQNFAVVARDDSPLESAVDLNGERIGVNAMNNIATLTTNSKLSAAGVRPGDVRYREFEFPDMTAALQRGDVDAAFLPEPFLSKAEIGYSVKTLFDPASGATAGIPVDGYGVMDEFVRANPRTVRAFRTALLEAQRRCRAPNVLRAVARRALKLKPTVAAVLSAGNYPISLDATNLQRVADLMQLFHAISEPVNVEEMVVQT